MGFCHILTEGNCDKYKAIMKIPGLSFSLKRAIGISGFKTKVARKTGIPTTKQGLERKIGGTILNGFFGRKKK
jgi:hypothetical protein